MMELFAGLFRLADGDETILAQRETIFGFDAELRKPQMVINCEQNG